MAVKYTAVLVDMPMVIGAGQSSEIQFGVFKTCDS